jgi:hypothetical protein
MVEFHASSLSPREIRNNLDSAPTRYENVCERVEFDPVVSVQTDQALGNLKIPA